MKTNYPYVIAEIGANHNGSMEMAKQMIRSAKDSGADAVKFQLYYPKDLCTYDYYCQLNEGTVKLENVSMWKTEELGLNDVFEQVEKFAVQEQEHIEYFNFARQIGIDYATSVFTKEGVDFCIDQKVAFLKLASCDVTNLDLIEYCLSKDYPLLISLGMADLAEIDQIVRMIPEKSKSKITLLHCVSLYPPKETMVNLNFMNTIRNTFGIKVGYSDHSLGFTIPLAAATLRASVIEKHFTLDKNLPGWDHKVSANPEELGIICKESKRIIDSLGASIRIISEEEIEKRKKFRRSCVVKNALLKGQVVTQDNLLFKRPGTGISADRYNEIVGRRVNKNIDADKTLFWEDLIK